VRRLASALAVALVVVLSSCSSSGSLADQMRSWVTSTGYGPSTGTLIRDAAKATQVLVEQSGVNSAHTVCAVMLLDAESANGNLPAPDPTATTLLAKAYNALGAAANACYAAPNSPQALSNFQTFKATGLADLSEATLRIGAIIGGTISTSTTRDNGAASQ